MIQLENALLTVSIAEKGAELQSIVHKATGLEYLWSGDPAYWGKKSPVLFPIVGGLKNDQYLYQGRSYQLGRHGFARDKTFTVTEQQAGTAVFTLTEDADTLAHYPFPFRFSLHYRLTGNSLQVTYQVANTGTGTLLFSVGGHPAFKVPLNGGSQYEAYYLRFNTVEDIGRWPLSPGGLIEKTPLPLLTHTNLLPLSKSLFYQDALVLKHLRSKSVALKSTQHPHGLQFHFEGFPYLGIWSAKNADFVCLEPWCGIADSVDASGQLEDKEGMLSLEAGSTFFRSWQADFF